MRCSHFEIQLGSISVAVTKLYIGLLYGGISILSAEIYPRRGPDSCQPSRHWQVVQTLPSRSLSWPIPWTLMSPRAILRCPRYSYNKALLVILNMATDVRVSAMMSERAGYGVQKAD